MIKFVPIIHFLDAYELYPISRKNNVALIIECQNILFSYYIEFIGRTNLKCGQTDFELKSEILIRFEKYPVGKVSF